MEKNGVSNERTMTAKAVRVATIGMAKASAASGSIEGCHAAVGA